jgi:hypothetical protein
VFEAGLALTFSFMAKRPLKGGLHFHSFELAYGKVEVGLGL